MKKFCDLKSFYWFLLIASGFLLRLLNLVEINFVSNLVFQSSSFAETAFKPFAADALLHNIRGGNQITTGSDHVQNRILLRRATNAKTVISPDAISMKI